MSSKQAGSLLNALSLAIALLRKQFFRVIFVVYGIKKDENNLPQEQESKERVYELSQPRQHQMGKAVKTKVKRNKRSLSKTVVKNRRVRGKLKNWMTIR